MHSDSRIAKISSTLGLAAVALLLIGPTLCQFGAAPMTGFSVFGLGLLAGLLALPLGAVGLWITRASATTGGRSDAIRGFGLGILVLALIIIAGQPGADVPPINDITTDMVDPPQFVAAETIPANQGRDLSYPGTTFAAQQQAGYPALAGQRLAMPPAEALAAVRTAAEGLGWTITTEDPAAGHLEATDTTRFFRFVDDIVIRVRPDGDASIVDVRSKSRDGRGDLGANAARIRALQTAL